MVVINVHQLKAAGKSLEGIFYREYGPQGTCFISKVPPKDEAFFITDYGQKLEAMGPGERDKISLLTGHMFFGLHEYFEEECTYISTLRDPVSRLISYYYYLLESDDMALSRMLKERNMAIEEFVALQEEDIDSLGLPPHAKFELEYMLENGQCKFLAGMHPRLGQSDQALLEAAMSNMINHFTAVGIAERFDDTIILFKRLLKWKFPLFYSRANVTANRPRRSAVSDGVRSTIEDRNKFDQRLYSFACEQFEKALEPYASTMAWDRMKLRMLNACFALYLRLRY